MSKHYEFDLTDAQTDMMKRLGIDVFPALMHFSPEDSSVVVYVWDEYQVDVYTVFDDGEYIHESRGLDTDGWETVKGNGNE